MKPDIRKKPLFIHQIDLKYAFLTSEYPVPSGFLMVFSEGFLVAAQWHFSYLKIWSPSENTAN